MREQELENEITRLKEEIKDLTMRLSAVKVMVTKITPVCSEKLLQLLESCSSCKGEE